MRALLVTRAVPQHPGSGGMERVSWDLARAMAESSEVTVLTTPVPGYPDDFTVDGIPVSTVRGARPGRYSMRWWARTLRYAPARDYDIVMSVSAAGTAMVHSQRGPSYVFQAHGTAMRELQAVLRLRPARWPLKALRFLYWVGVDSLTYRRVDEVVAASEQVAASLRSRPYKGAWKRTRLRVIPNAVDDAHFAFDDRSRADTRSRLGVGPSDTVVLTVSRLDRQKGVDRALAAAAVAGPGTHHVIGGSGPEEAALREEALRLGLAGRAHFLGQLDHDAVRSVLHAADVFVLPVRQFQREALPLSVLEALAAGLPVVVPVGSVWPEDLVPLLRFADMADAGALAEALAGSRPAPGRASRLPGRYSVTQWANGRSDDGN